MPLVFFHFHGFKKLLRFVWRTHHRNNGQPYRGFLARRLYRPYIGALQRGAAMGASVGIGPSPLLQRPHTAPGSRTSRVKALLKILRYRDFVIGR